MPTPDKLMQIGQQLVDMNNNNQSRECVQQMYAKDCVSAEAIAMPGQSSNEVTGVDAILAKHDWWESANEVHASSAEGPFAHGNDRFSVIYDMDITDKQSGERTQMREVATYYVNEDGHIHREEFAYPLG
ncbi:SnoaL-like domain-containing protein [Litorimonas sp. RW-G-Af-16]|uniref:SnoaL-like domain-containing protein n=1 Tax=Litorimonas sp. RW-G-Af-16 TaxID=3241168 RepID=UPI00390C989E